ncbi:MAG: glutamine-synthetase adenylyltransferase, partial [Bryobacteraceae bacterium]|nr:glutamine-synthetase adenylyltransferase [Bryobacteraceae bacterium]
MQRLHESVERPDPARKYLLTASADPETAARFLDAFERRYPDVATRLASSSAGLQALIATFSNSRFLSEAVLQHPDWLEQIVDSGQLYKAPSVEELFEQLEQLVPKQSPISALSLALFRRRQLLRILLRDVFGLATLSELTGEISNVADVILEVAYRRIRADLIVRYGIPVFASSDGIPHECGFSVIALGKLGGRELNYSSDIDLMFVYSAHGETTGEVKITAGEFFKKVANAYTELLSTYTSEGTCYRVDLRLRPDGKQGEVCISLDGAKSYYASRARDWELQMLIKGRVAAGETEPGKELLDAAEPRIYSSTLDFSAIEAVSLTRVRIHEKLAARRAGTDGGLDVKLTRGGIRDIEFLVQCLQRLHGGREPWVRHGGTMMALTRLNDKNLISAAEYARLASAYQFLRHLEHRLQFVDDRQIHSLPSRRDELSVLARRMPESELGRIPSADKLLHQLNGHLEEVQETYDRVIHAQQPLYYSSPVPERASQNGFDTDFEQYPQTNLVRFLDQRAPQIGAALQGKPLRRGARAFEAFLENVFDRPAHLELLNDSPALTGDIVDIFDNSPWYAEELVRRPGLLESVSQARENVQPVYGDLG